METKARLQTQPITHREAKRFIEEHHRHNPSTHGWKFGIGLNDGEKVVGVVIVGRPVARGLDDGWTAEVTRCCTDGTPNACSMLYGAAWRAARAMGYRRLVTYTGTEEPGSSLKAAGFTALYQTKAKSWDMPGRPRVDKHDIRPRTLWEISAA